ncbi:MAG: hypothetical protein P3X22_003640 [Thermoprotei archaeon]|nr:hypothetical protein [Thermoprotei archaeon]
METKIPLYPETLFGYYLQLTALGLGGWTKPVSRVLVIDSEDYVRLVENAMNKIAYMSRVELGAQGSYTSICEWLRGPKLYTAGKSDIKILRNAGLLGQQDKDWCTATVTYVIKVKQNKGPLGIQCSPLMLHRATAYGKTRGVVLKDVDKIATSTVDSVGLALIGGLASFLGNVKVRDEWLEYLLVPDGSPESLENIDSVLEVFRGTATRARSLVDRINTLTSLRAGGLSVDFATLFSAILQASEAVESAEGLMGLIRGMLFERYILARSSAGARPQVMWMSPLTISQIVENISSKKVVGFLRSLYGLASMAPRIRDNFRSEVESVVAECVNTSLLYFWTRQPEFLVICSRGLSILDDKAREQALNDVADLALRALMLAKRVAM